MPNALITRLQPADRDPDRWLDAHLIETDAPTADARGPEPQPDEETEVEDRPPGFSDEDLALKFTRKHRNLLRYVAKWGRWFIWKGSLWIEDETLQAFDLSRAICRRASSACSHPKIRAAVASAKTVAAVERLAKADRAHAASAAQWDADPWLLNTPGGTVDLRTGRLRPHQPTDYMTKITAAAPASGAECPLWHKFLDRVTGADADLQAFLQRITGSALTGITEDHALFFLYGTGRNGKGVFINTITRLLGFYATIASMETFTASQHDRHPADLAALRGARLVAAQETEEGRNWAETRIKALTGGDPISARFMRQDFFSGPSKAASNGSASASRHLRRSPARPSNTWKPRTPSRPGSPPAARPPATTPRAVPHCTAPTRRGRSQRTRMPCRINASAKLSRPVAIMRGKAMGR